MLKELKKDIQLILRGYKLIWTIDNNLIIWDIFRALLTVVSPYTTIYLSARIISGIAAGEPFRQLMFYAALTIFIQFAMSLLTRAVTRKVNAANQTRHDLFEIYFSSVNRNMQYEHLENPETHLRKDRITRAADASGFGFTYLIFQIEGCVNAIASVILSVTLTASLFTARVPGHTDGLWGFLNSPWAFLPILGLLIFQIFAVSSLNRRSADVFYREIKNFADQNRLSSYYHGMLEEYETGAEIRLFHEAPLIEKSWLKTLIHPTYLQNVIRAQSRFARIRSCVGFVMNISLYLFIAAKAYLGAFGIGNFVLYTGAISRFVNAMTNFFGNAVDLKANNAYLEEIFAYIDMPNSMYQGTLPVEKRAFCEGGDNEYEIEFRDVSFRYPASDAYALRHINLKFRIGERMAVVGKNGSGKTTFIKLLCRLYDPTEGEILLNGIDIKKYNYAEYMSLFSVVFQDFKLLSFSLGQNVAAAVQYDPERVEACLREAGFGDRLEHMPDGLETYLYKSFDEKGVEISGGEAQKIALARALYKDAPFIVLDEPTAALDPVAESEVYSKFNEMVHDKTAVYISHRLSSCRFCDDIVVFDNGQVVQRGSHDTLVADQSGVYHDLWTAQAQYYVAE